MTLMRTFLRPVAQTAALSTELAFRAFMRATRRTRQVQDRVLQRLIARCRNTDFGRDHGLSTVNNYDDFIRAVPLGNYETLRPYVDRVLAGQTTALLPEGEPVLMFSMTSGTTGEPKHIPVTPTFAAHMKRTFSIFGYRAIRAHNEVWLRSILPISSPLQETTSQTGLPCGAISGLLRNKQRWIVRQMYAVPAAVSGLPDPEAKYYAMLRCSVGRDVSFITTANPSSTIKLIETGQQHAERLIRDITDGTFTPPAPIDPEVAALLRFRPNRALAARLADGIRRDGELRPKHFWNVAFLANWTGGTLKLYLPRLRELFDNIPIRDVGLVASEGRFSLPLADNTPAGVAEITSNFLEFIAADESEQDTPTVLRAHEVEVGKEYFLVATNYAGLWRYNMDDRVRVVDKMGDSPVFEFLSRGRNTANITGEKITEHQVVEAMRTAAAQTANPIDRFVMQGRYDTTPYYELRAESASNYDLAPLAEAMDRALAELNIEYASKRKSARLGAIRPVALPAGALAEAEDETIRQRHGRSEQYKHQYLLTEVLTDDSAGPGNA